MSASEAEYESSETDSPVIRTRPIPQQQKVSGSDDEGSENEDQEEFEEEEVDEQQKENPQSENRVAKSTVMPPASGPGAAVTVPQHPKYDKMVEEAVKELVENKRSGTSIQKILKFITNKYLIAEPKAKFFCKKSLEKGLKNEMYIKTSGVGFSGSVNFTTSYRKKLKAEQTKLLKPKKTKESKVKPKAKPAEAKTKKDTIAKKRGPTSKAEPKVKQAAVSKKDKNNNPAPKTGSKNAKIANTKTKISKTGKVRLSINAKIAPQPKAKPKVTAKVKPSVTPTEKKPAKTKPSAGPSKAKTTSSEAKVQAKKPKVKS
ncbi:histone H1-I-like [Wyeomyia smithii]|uniref:histone H1-I-like n=1 Tax=Wyeomyia smithii TaxID=174621 RepID=UPI002467B923|nr:histone H1-I-like [Wyeomyia smithii]XP_055548103.1 histone H1-I-like [Wyeomyia smithii]XP_055548105.1 histone H1-I-like [Wyeomyia smithii]XP_055548106.1 histone H1-I-like [Wyeomyia smithii]XP_055548107.1 histone H1-I-like [Wyeomyia smithii]